MPGAWDSFVLHRGGPGWSLDWEGYKFKLYALEAAREAIDEVSRMGADMARTVHPWENRTGQTEAAIFHKEAEIEWVGTTANSTPHVWGEWGVEDRPRWKTDARTGEVVVEDVSTKDVAMFLEFGVGAHDIPNAFGLGITVRHPGFEKKPFLYPAWDATKVQLPRIMAEKYAAIEMSGFTPASFRPRGAGGRFLSPTILGL